MPPGRVWARLGTGSTPGSRRHGSGEEGTPEGKKASELAEKRDNNNTIIHLLVK